MAINIPDNPNPAPNYIQTVTFADPLNLDADDSNAFYCLITGNTTLNILNTREGGTYLVELIMDAVGGHTVTLGVLFGGVVVGSLTFNTAANAVNFISIVRGVGDYLTYNIINVTV